VDGGVGIFRRPVALRALNGYEIRVRVMSQKSRRPGVSSGWRSGFIARGASAAMACGALAAVGCGKGCTPPPCEPGQACPGTGGTGGTPGTLGDNKPPGSLPYILAVTPMPQEQLKWCWAASASMIATYIDGSRANDLLQCKFASVGGPDCCASPLPTGCDRPGYPRFDVKGFSFDIHREGWPTWQGVKGELGSNRPFALTETYPVTGGAHMRVATGAHEVLGDAVLKVYDPAGDGVFWWYDYTDYRTAEKDRVPGYTHYRVHPASPARCLTDDLGTGANACNNTGIPSAGPAPSCAPSTLPTPVVAVNLSLLAARDGLLRVRAIGQADPGPLGFTSAADAQDAKLSLEAYYIHDVELATLVSACPSFQTRSAFVDDYLYVSQATGTGLGFIEVKESTPGTWKPIAYGNSPDAKEIHAIAAMLKASPPGLPPRPVLLRVRPLRLYLLVAPQSGGGVKLYPSRKIGGLTPGLGLPEAQTITQLRIILPGEINGGPF
jgi:hypothetical protein